MWYTVVIPALRKWSWEDQEFKVIYSYTVSSRPVQAVLRLHFYCIFFIVVCTHMLIPIACVWKAKDNFGKFSASSTMGSSDGTRVIRPAQLSSLVSLLLLLCYMTQETNTWKKSQHFPTFLSFWWVLKHFLHHFKIVFKVSIQNNGFHFHFSLSFYVVFIGSPKALSDPAGPLSRAPLLTMEIPFLLSYLTYSIPLP